MLLNLMCFEGADPEQLIRLSYRQFQTERALPALEAQVKKLEVRGAGVLRLVCSHLSDPQRMNSPAAHWSTG
jgi:hypothetical protein